MDRRHSFRRRASEDFRFLWERFWRLAPLDDVGLLAGAAFDDLLSGSMVLSCSLAAEWNGATAASQLTLR